MTVGGPLLLMELGSILQRSGAHVFWITANKKKTTSDLVVQSLEKKLLNQGIQVLFHLCHLVPKCHYLFVHPLLIVV